MSAMTAVPHFTPTESRMLAVLADGLPHSRAELHACLFDDLGPLSNVNCHLTAIRRKLRPAGQTIVCELRRLGICYRRVRLFVDGDE